MPKKYVDFDLGKTTQIYNEPRNLLANPPTIRTNLPLYPPPHHLLTPHSSLVHHLQLSNIKHPPHQYSQQ
jgi:hypothetical protein